MAQSKHVDIYTDGACLGNPGPGGYAAILVYGKEEREVTGGFRLTTNNRMEIMAAIGGLSALKVPCSVTLYSDSKYLVNSMKGGFVQKWRAMGWKRNKKERAQNPDLWEQLLQLTEQHQVSWEWVHGHRGHEMNERCDRMAVAAANGFDLAADEGYEREHPEARLQSTPARTPDASFPRDEQKTRRILAVLDACRDDSDAKRVEYDDSEGFDVFASTSQAAWRYKFGNLDRAYALVQSRSSVRPYRFEA